MRWFSFGGMLSLTWLLVLGAPAPARALVAAPAPGPMRVLQHQVVVLAQVLALEDKDVEVVDPNSKSKTMYRVAVLQVNEMLKGDATAKTIKLGFPVPMKPMQPQGGVLRPIISSGGGYRGVQPMAGQDGLYYLNKHPHGDFYQAPIFYDFVSSQTADFKKQVALVRSTMTVEKNPLKSLESKDAQERLVAVALLLNKYRSPRGPAPKQEPIDAAESKLILQALADANWQDAPRFGELSPQHLFFQLGVTAQDGYNPPKVIRNIQEVQQPMRDWLLKNANTYRIKRFVAAAPAAQG